MPHLSLNIQHCEIEGLKHLVINIVRYRHLASFKSDSSLFSTNVVSIVCSRQFLLSFAVGEEGTAMSNHPMGTLDKIFVGYAIQDSRTYQNSRQNILLNLWEQS